ncbi:MAG: hypothetical protein LBV12_11585 [Puniceicoccales bacterium]|jgi:hypothetical protein|nr:hypothetical protein [Puniceicoccales bacterium]
MNNVSKILVLNLFLASTSLPAAFVCVGDFETAGTLGSSVSAQNWSGDAAALTSTTIAQAPDDPNNQVLKTTCSTSAKGIYLNLGESGTIASGATGTVFFRAYYSASTSYSLGFGARYSQDGDRTLQAQISTSSVAASKWQVYSSSTGAIGATTPSSLLTESWYNIWIVINPDGVANTWQAYYALDGGAQTIFAAGGASTFSFKKGALYDRPIDQFSIVFTGVSGVAVGDASPVYFDDIYVDTSAMNLATPVLVPEANTLFWCGGLGVMVAGIVSRRFFQKRRGR